LDPEYSRIRFFLFLTMRVDRNLRGDRLGHVSR
jgi:hypothetical protein